MKIQTTSKIFPFYSMFIVPTANIKICVCSSVSIRSQNETTIGRERERDPQTTKMLTNVLSLM